MPKPFYTLSLDQFSQVLNQFPFKRRINAVHLHHTLRPNHSQYNGLASIEALGRFHTQTKGLSDMAQHVTVAPDGKIWTGRSWNQPPVSAAGHNGNTEAGPFMISVIGDFNEGGDSFEGRQREVVLQIIAQVQQLFKLPVDSLYFHSQMSAQSCPGNSIDYAKIITAVSELRAKSEEGKKEKTTRRKDVGESPFSPEAREESGEIKKIIETLSRDPTGPRDPLDGGLDHDNMSAEDVRLLTGMESLVAPLPGRAGETRGIRAACDPSTPAVRTTLRPHVINLSQGQFSGTGQYTTSPSDVDAIFGEHLERAVAAAKQNKDKLRLLFYAHGGLVKEASGLAQAYEQIPWWLDNKVYPIYFIWETGFGEILGQLLSGAQQRALPGVSRDVFDFTTDPIIEAAVRRLGGVQLWSGIKRSAERAMMKPSARAATFDGGGAYYVARKLKAFCDKHGDAVELHAVGHSAGSIFHAHFLSTALDLGVPAFRSLHFMAPAIRTDEFSRLLAPRLGRGIDQLTIFTMAKDYELADNCASIYHKSILYLLYYALETEAKTPILGLEESLRSNDKLAQLFGLNGHKSAVGQVIWAVSQTETGLSASLARSHMDFDNEGATLHSVLRRILSLDDMAQIKTYPETATRAISSDYWGDFTQPLAEGHVFVTPGYPAAVSTPVQTPSRASQPAASAASLTPVQAGQRRALCVGIDAYRTSPLNGCVADAEMWGKTLTQLGFQTTLLRNGEATYETILKTLGGLVEASQPGDVVVFQYAGHGTQVRDLNQDEQAGDSPQLDEALCPYDFDQGRLLIDDDVAEVFSRIPDGVNMTCFFDCCHSGTSTRFGVGVPEQDNSAALDERPRYIAADAALEEAHRRFRESRPKFRAAKSRGPVTMREVLFSACRSNEVAWESNGHGDFTIRATPLLSAGLAGLTNETFQRRLAEAFGSTPRQHPELDCAPATKERGLLQPLTGQAAALPTSGAVPTSPADGLEAIAQGLKLLADLLMQRR